MRRSAILAAPFCLLAHFGSAGSLELAGWAGGTFPFYDQSFNYDPGPLVSPIAGVTLRQEGAFQLHGTGGLAAGAGVTWYLTAVVGIEARFDTADVHVEPQGAVYRVSADLPAPLPDLSTSVDLGSGTVDVGTVTPLSLNVKLRTPGPVALAVSGGLSYLPELGFSARQTVGLGVTGLGGGQLAVATLALRADARPAGPGDSRFGADAGAGLQINLAPKLRLLVEGRYFRFGKQTLEWSRGDTRPLSPVEEALLREVEGRLDPVEFRPTFFQATAGLALLL